MNWIALFKIAAGVSTPLALGGLTVAGFIYIAKAILSNNVRPTIRAQANAGIVELIVEKLFWLAAIGMILGSLGFIITQNSAASGTTTPTPRATVTVTAEATGHPHRDVQDVARQLAIDLAARQIAKGDKGKLGFRVGFKQNDVPQVWTTSQSLTALLSPNVDSNYDPSSLRLAIEYIKSGRKPFPVNGWGYFESQNFSITEVDSWVALAYIAAWRAPGVWSPEDQADLKKRVNEELALVVGRQAPDGGFSPTDEPFPMTYSTVMATWAISEAKASGLLRADYTNVVKRAMLWLLQHHDPKRGWVPDPKGWTASESNKLGDETDVLSYPGLTAQAIFVMGRAEDSFGCLRGYDTKIDAYSEFIAGASKLATRSVNDDTRWEGGYIGEKNKISLEASRFAWLPWSIAAYSLLGKDSELTPEQRDRARAITNALRSRTSELVLPNNQALSTWEMAEILFCVRTSAAS